MSENKKDLVEVIKNAARTAPPVIRTVLNENNSAGHEVKIKAAKPPPFHFKPQAASHAEEQEKVLDTLEQDIALEPGAQENLAALLGYGDDDEDDEEQDDGSQPNATKPPTANTAGDESAPSVSAKTDALDSELALFMQQLESDGLLKNDAKDASLDGTDNISNTSAVTELKQTGDRTTAAQLPTSKEAELPLVPSSDGSQAADTSHQATAMAAGGSNVQTDEQGTTDHTATDEQQVLGYLRRNPSWSKCLDGASGQPYYWHLETNEVLWDAPEGLDPDDLITVAEDVADEGNGEETAVGIKDETEDVAEDDDSRAKAQQASRQHLPVVAEGNALSNLTQRQSNSMGSPAGLELKQRLTGLLAAASDSALYFLSSMPRIVRLAIELEVRLADWNAIETAMDRTNSGAEPQAFEHAYVQHMTRVVKEVEGGIKSALQESATVQQQGRAAAQTAQQMYMQQYENMYGHGHGADQLHTKPLDNSVRDGRSNKLVSAATKQLPQEKKEETDQPLEEGEVGEGDNTEQSPAIHPSTGAPTTTEQKQPVSVTAASDQQQHESGSDLQPVCRLAYDRRHQAAESRRHGYEYPQAYHHHGLHGVYHDGHEDAYSWAAHSAYHHAYHHYQEHGAAYGPYNPYHSMYAAGGGGYLGSSYADSMLPTTAAQTGAVDASRLTPPLPDEAPLPVTPPLPEQELEGPPGISIQPPLPPLPDSHNNGGMSNVSVPPSDGGTDASKAQSPVTKQTALSTGVAEVEDMELDESDTEDAAQLSKAHPAVQPMTATELHHHHHHDVFSYMALAAQHAQNSEQQALSQQQAVEVASDMKLVHEAKQQKRKEYVSAAVMHNQAVAAAQTTSGRSPSPEAVDKQRTTDKKRKAAASSLNTTKKSKSDVSKTSDTLKRHSKVGALVDQWKSVQKTLAEEAAREAQEQEELLDAEVIERRRAAEAAAWMQQQAQSGQAADNANLAPVVGDWRKTLAQVGGIDVTAAAPATASTEGEKDKHKHKHKKEKHHKSSKSGKSKHSSKEAAAAATGDSSGILKSSKTRPDLDALSVGLPEGWRAMWDKESGDIYYGNPETKEVSWSRP